MATRTISPAGGNWKETTTWVEGAVPTKEDDVVATSESGNLTRQNEVANVRSINLTNYKGTFTIEGASGFRIGTSTINAEKISLLFPSAGWTYNQITTSTFEFLGTAAEESTIDFGGHELKGSLFVKGTATYKLVNSLTIPSTAELYLEKGTLNTNGQSVSIGKFKTNLTNTRKLVAGKSIITLTSQSGTVWNIETTTGLTLEAAEATIVITGASASAKKLVGSGITGLPSITVAASANTGIIEIGSAENNTWGALLIELPSHTRVVKFGAAHTQTFSSVTAKGATGNLISMESLTAGTAWTLSVAAGTVSCDYLKLQDSHATGGAAFFAGSHSENISGNEGWKFEPPALFKATITSLGTIPRTIFVSRLAKLSFQGKLPVLISHGLQSGLNFVGKVQKSITKNIQATISLVGSLVVQQAHVIVSSLTFTKTSKVKTTNQLRGSVEFIKTFPIEVTKNLKSTLSFKGFFNRIPIRIIPATISFVGKIGNQDFFHTLSATLSFAKTIPQTITKKLTSGLSFLLKLPEFEEFPKIEFVLFLKASISFAKTLGRKTSKKLIAGVTFKGALQRRTRKALQGSFNFLGHMGNSIITRGINALVSFTGQITHNITAAQTAVLTFSKNLQREIFYPLSAALSFVGSIASRTTSKIQNAALEFAGVFELNRKTIKNLKATLPFLGKLKQNLTYAFLAGLSFSAAIITIGTTIQRLEALLSFSKVLQRSIRTRLSGSLEFLGIRGASLVHKLEIATLNMNARIQQTIQHSFVSTLSFAVRTTRIIYHGFTAKLESTASISVSVFYTLRAQLSSEGVLFTIKILKELFTASLEFAGQLPSKTILVLQGALSFLGRISFLKVLSGKPQTDSLIRKTTSIPTLISRRTETGDIYELIENLVGFPEFEFQSIVTKRHTGTQQTAILIYPKPGQNYDQLIRFIPSSNIIKLAPDTFEYELSSDQLKLVPIIDE